MHKLSTEYIRQARKAKARSKGNSRVHFSAAQKRAIEELQAQHFSALNADDLRYSYAQTI